MTRYDIRTGGPREAAMLTGPAECLVLAIIAAILLRSVSWLRRRARLLAKATSMSGMRGSG